MFLEITQPGVISAHAKVLALAHMSFVPVNNHMWGSALVVAVNLHLLTAMRPARWAASMDTDAGIRHDAKPVSGGNTGGPLGVSAQVSAHDGAEAPERPWIGLSRTSDY